MDEDRQTEIVNEAFGFVLDIAKTGFESRSYLIEQAADLLLDDGYTGEIEPAAQAIADRAIETLTAEQADWPVEGDCEKFDRAFEALKASGIFARHHYSCCGTCGTSEIYMEIDDALERGEQVRGHTYYHVQDTESAVAGGSLFLAYGDAEGTDEGTRAIGHEVCEALKREGIDVDWNGDIRRRIWVKLDWKRRWPPRVPDRMPERLMRRSDPGD